MNIKDTIHLAIDVQSGHIFNLRPTRISSFPAGIKQFKENLPTDIPTLWVVWGDPDRRSVSTSLFVRGENEEGGGGLRARYGLLAAGAREDESIFEKFYDNAFHAPVLGDYFRETGIKRLLITGMNTHWCVANTVLGALEKGFETVILYDLLADSYSKTHEGRRGGDPAWHREEIEGILGSSRPNMAFMTSAEYLASLDQSILDHPISHRPHRDHNRSLPSPPVFCPAPAGS